MILTPGKRRMLCIVSLAREAAATVSKDTKAQPAKTKQKQREKEEVVLSITANTAIGKKIARQNDVHNIHSQLHNTRVATSQEKKEKR